MSQQENPAQRQKPSLNKIKAVAKTQKKKKESLPDGILKAWIYLNEEIEVNGTRYKTGLKKGKVTDPLRIIKAKHTKNDAKWLGKQITFAQVVDTDAFIEILTFMVDVWELYPNAIKSVRIYLNTVEGKPKTAQYAKEDLAELKTLLFSNEATAQ